MSSGSSLSLAQLAQLIRDAPGKQPVAYAVRKVGEYLDAARGDALRDFFRARLAPGGREAYKELLSALFALDSSTSDGWLGHAATGEHARQRDAAAALRAFLAPAGPLLRAVAWMDADGGVLYAFPPDLLPERARRLLAAGPAGLAALREALPYRGCVCAAAAAVQAQLASAAQPPLLQLTPGRYFLFWTAYAALRPGAKLRLAAAEVEVPLPSAQPLLAAAAAARDAAAQASPRAAAGVGAGASRLLHTALAAAHHPAAAPRPQPQHPYRDLVLGLLAAAAPLPPVTARAGAQPASPAAAAAAPPPALALRCSAEELVAILREFWLPDSDDLPAALAAGGARAAGPPPGPPPFTLAPPAGGQRYVPPPSFVPPSEDRLAAIRMLVSYLGAAPPPGPQPSGGGSGVGAAAAAAAAPLAAQCGVSPLLATLHRPLYRLLRGALEGWPADSQASLRPLLLLWSALLLPWAAAPRDRLLEAACPGALPPAVREEARWRAAVEASAPFATKMLEHWVAFACVRVQVDAGDAAEVLTAVLAALAALGEGHLEALRALEAAHNAALPGARAAPGPLAAKGAALLATLLDWEAPPRDASAAGRATPPVPRTPGAAPPPAAGLPTAAPLHTLDPGLGVSQWVAVLMQRIEREAAFAAASASPIRPELRLRLQAYAFAVLRLPPGPPPGSGGGGGARRAPPADDAEGLARPGLARRMLADKHLPARDPLTLPIASHELPFLARPLARLSLALRERARACAEDGRLPAWLRRALLACSPNLRPLSEPATLGCVAAVWLLWRVTCWFAGAFLSLFEVAPQQPMYGQRYQ